jgi:hypothetical protein
MHEWTVYRLNGESLPAAGAEFIGHPAAIQRSG